MDDSRSDDLKRWELVVSAELARVDWLKVGEALWHIREPKLYLVAGFDNWESYCRERWGWTRRHADHLIQSYRKAVEMLGDSEQTGTTVPDCLPENERQARELSRIEDPEERRLAWLEAQANADDREEPVRQRHVTEAVNRRRDPEPVPPLTPSNQRLGPRRDRLNTIDDIVAELTSTLPLWEFEMLVDRLKQELTRRKKVTTGE